MLLIYRGHTFQTSIRSPQPDRSRSPIGVIKRLMNATAMKLAFFQSIKRRVRLIGAGVLKANRLNLKIKLNEGNPTQLQHEPSLQPDSPYLSNPLPRPTLIARWEIENNKLVCHWVIDDRPFNTSADSQK